MTVLLCLTVKIDLCAFFLEMTWLWKKDNQVFKINTEKRSYEMAVAKLKTLSNTGDGCALFFFPPKLFEHTATGLAATVPVRLESC